jgi:hypothetical protein
MRGSKQFSCIALDPHGQYKLLNSDTEGLHFRPEHCHHVVNMDHLVMNTPTFFFDEPIHRPSTPTLLTQLSRLKNVLSNSNSFFFSNTQEKHIILLREKRRNSTKEGEEPP